MAVQSLRRNECDMAIVGGVNLMLSPFSMLPIAKWGMMSPDGKCKTFSAEANGFVRGEGCGVIILQRRELATKTNRPVRALIRGSAVNQDGKTNVLTAPNGLMQQQVIESALEDAGIPGHTIGYVEAHGTGTALGDPIEMEALRETVGKERVNPCFISSVKTNMGHLEAAAGIAGAIKAILTVQNGVIPPHLHFQQLNPHIQLGDVPFVVPTTEQVWDGDEQPRRAGVSAFGFGGTNAHIILESVPEEPIATTSLTSTGSTSTGSTSTGSTSTGSVGDLLLLSAGGMPALHALADQVAEQLSNGGNLADLCYTAAVHRTHLTHRLGGSRQNGGRGCRHFTPSE